MKTKAFSLIELMVVIAIVAVLAAIAVPAYKQYVIKSNFTKAAVMIDRLVDESISFATINGRFPNAYELGLADNPGDQFGEPSKILSMFPQIHTNHVWVHAPGDSCGSLAVIKITLDPVKLGFDVVEAEPTNADNTIYGEIYFWHTDGVFYTNYQYKYCLDYNTGGLECGKYGNIFQYTWVNTDGNYNTPVIFDPTLLTSYNNRSCL